MVSGMYGLFHSNTTVKRLASPCGLFLFAQMDYKSKRWERLRADILKRDNYMCQESLRYGKRVQANTVHHIFPAKLFPEYQWEPWNLISLSGAVHNEMHVRDTDELTDRGLDLLRRTARKNKISIPPQS